MHKPIWESLSILWNFNPELEEGNRLCTNVAILSSSSPASFPNPRRAFSRPSWVVKFCFVLSGILPCALVIFCSLYVLVLHIGSSGYINSFILEQRWTLPSESPSLRWAFRASFVTLKMNISLLVLGPVLLLKDGWPSPIRRLGISKNYQVWNHQVIFHSVWLTEPYEKQYPLLRIPYIENIDSYLLIVLTRFLQALTPSLVPTKHVVHSAW